MKNGGHRARPLRLTRSERSALQRLLRTGRTGLWLATRARAVLLHARGESVSAIAQDVGRDRKWVRHWLGRENPSANARASASRAPSESGPAGAPGRALPAPRRAGDSGGPPRPVGPRAGARATTTE